MLKNLLMQDANFVAQVAGPMANPQLTTAQVELFRKMLDANGTIMRRIMGLMRTDEETFDYTEAINGMVEEHKQAAAMMEQQEQEGAMNAQSAPPEAGGAGPGPEAVPDGGGPDGPPGEPPLPLDSIPPEETGLLPM